METIGENSFYDLSLAQMSISELGCHALSEVSKQEVVTILLCRPVQDLGMNIQITVQIQSFLPISELRRPQCRDLLAVSLRRERRQSWTALVQRGLLLAERRLHLHGGGRR